MVPPARSPALIGLADCICLLDRFLWGGVGERRRRQRRLVSSARRGTATPRDGIGRRQAVPGAPATDTAGETLRAGRPAKPAIDFELRRTNRNRCC